MKKIYHYYIALACLLCSPLLMAQSFFYNSQHFGMRSILLGGAVSGGNDDLSMVYYNPAALYMSEEGGKDIDVSLIMPQLSLFGIDNYLDEERNTNDIDLSLNSNLASFRLELRDSFHIVFTLLQQDVWDNKLEYNEQYNVGSDRLERVFNYNYQGSDVWIGAGMYHKLSPKLHIGLSQFFSIASYDYGYTLKRTVFTPSADDFSDLFSNYLKLDYGNTLSLLSKVGLVYESWSNRIGLTIKTPNYFSFFKSGSLELENYEYKNEMPNYTSVRNFDLNPTIKTPWELSLGYVHTFRDCSQLFVNLSHYTQIKDYELANFNSIEDEAIVWRSASKAVTNISIGVKKRISAQVELIGGMRTNFLAAEQYASQDAIEWVKVVGTDKHHITLGSNFITPKGNSMTVGIDWAFSTADNDEIFKQFKNIDKFDTTPSEFQNNVFNLLITYGFLFD